MLSYRQLVYRLNTAKGIHFLFILAYCALFIASRYPFYKYLPFPLPVVADGSEYYEVYREMLNGRPLFDVITPGYPAFIYAVHEFFSQQAIALYLAQSVVTFFAGLLLLFSAYRHYRVCVPFISIALCLFLCQDLTLRFETASFPQSLMIAGAFIFLAALMGVLNRPRWMNILLLSASGVFLLLLKSSQMFILPILVLVVCYCFAVRRKKVALRIVACIFAPLLVYAGYNYFTLGEFTIISPGILKQEDNHRVFSKSEQQIFYKIGANLPSWHPIYKVHHASNLDTLQQAYLKARWGATLRKDSIGTMRLHVTFEMKETVNADSIVQNNPAFSADERTWYLSNKNSLEGLFIHFYPRKWKRFKTYVLNYFFNIKSKSPLFYYADSEIGWRYKRFFITHGWTDRYDLTNPQVKDKLSFLLREYYLPQGSQQQFNAQYAKMTADPSFRLFDFFNLKIGRPLAKNVLWAYAYFLLGLIVVVRYLMHFRNPHLFFLLTMVLIHLGSCLLHAIWGDPLNRYSLATEFVPYFLVAFSPLLFMKRQVD